MPRLFEQTEDNDPDLSNRIAFGKAATATGNMTFTNFLTWIFGKLNFLKSSNNLSDVASSSTSRTNLGVYSKSEVDSAVGAKLSAYPTANGGLRVTNSTTFHPTSSYHPATKRYVDGYTSTGYRANHILSGTYHYGDVGSGGDQDITITHNLGHTDYRAFYTLYTPNAQAGDNDIAYDHMITKSANSFVVRLRETAGEVQDLYIEWMILITAAT